jgi:tellurite resistance protein
MLGSRAMHVHAAAFHAIVKATGVNYLADDEAKAVAGIAQLVAGADDKEDEEETAVLQEIIDHLSAFAGLAVAIPTVQANDDYERLEKIREVGARLPTAPSRELAYALAYAVSISDMDLAPAESEFLADLAVAIGISDDRADELASIVGQAVTPPA